MGECEKELLEMMSKAKRYDDLVKKDVIIRRKLRQALLGQKQLKYKLKRYEEMYPKITFTGEEMADNIVKANDKLDLDMAELTKEIEIELELKRQAYHEA